MGLRSIVGWSLAAKLSVIVVLLGLAGDAVLAFDYMGALQDFEAGSASFNEVSQVEQRLFNVDRGLFAAQVIAAVCSITFLYRAAQNAEKIEPARMNFTPKWAIWGWFVPFMNLIRPYQMVKETWEASRRQDRSPTPETLFKIWWGLWIVSNITIRFNVNVGVNTGPNVDTIIRGMRVSLLGSLLSLVTGVLFLQIITMIEKRQTGTIAAGAIESELPAHVLPEADETTR